MAILIGSRKAITTEIARSFSYKLNTGNYESRDFFCSQKAECAIEDADRVSELLHEFCRKQVLVAVKQYLKDLERQRKPEGMERKSA